MVVVEVRCRCWYECWKLQEGCTALIVAVCSGKVGAMALLLDRGADLEAKDKVSPPFCPLGMAAPSMSRRVATA